MTPRGLLRALPVVLVVAMLAVAAVAAGAGGARVGRVPVAAPSGTARQPTAGPTFSPPPAETNQPQSSPDQSGPPSWVFVVIGAVVLALVYGAVLLWLMLTVKDALVFRRRRRAPEPAEEVPAGRPSPEQVRAAVQAGIDALISGDDARAAVIACWLRLEQLAEYGGVPRRPSDAPGDLVARMLDGALTGDGVRALRELAEVYRAARYAPHPVPEAARDTARAALDRIRAELADTAVGG